MKKMLVFILITLPLCAHAMSFPIGDGAIFSFGSQGLFTYGLHSNTFHLRYFYVMSGLEWNDLSVFVTLSGMKDTHVPETNYGFILDNVMLYDYGVSYRFFDLAELSFRGAAVIRPESDSYLLMPCYFDTNNPANFDTPLAYQPYHAQAAGLRLAFQFAGFELAYSQGDFRHLIPIGARLSYTNAFSGGNFSVSALLYLENSDPLVYTASNWTFAVYANVAGELALNQVWSVGGKLQANYVRESGRFSFIGEEALIYKPLDLTLAFREIGTSSTNVGPLFEVSFTKEFDDAAELGLFAASDGRYYIGTSIDF